MSDGIFSPQFVEFNEQVYFGPEYGYVKTLRLNLESQLDAPFANHGMTNQGLISFEGNGYVVFVSEHNIRFIYAHTLHTSSQAIVESEAVAEAEPQPAPKRRGRPPKARP